MRAVSRTGLLGNARYVATLLISRILLANSSSLTTTLIADIRGLPRSRRMATIPSLLEDLHHLAAEAAIWYGLSLIWFRKGDQSQHPGQGVTTWMGASSAAFVMHPTWFALRSGAPPMGHMPTRRITRTRAMLIAKI